MIREPQDQSLLPETVLLDRMTWIADQWEQDPATYTDTYMQMVEPISGCEAFLRIKERNVY